MAEPGRNVLLSTQERRLVDIIKEMYRVSSEMRAMITQAGAQPPPEEVQAFVDKISALDGQLCAEFELDPDAESTDIKMYIETVNLFHRTVPRDVVEGFWRANFSTQGAVLALMTGSMSPLVLNESMFRLIGRLRIDQDGWVEGIDD